MKARLTAVLCIVGVQLLTRGSATSDTNPPHVLASSDVSLDIQTITQRRLSTIVGATTGATSVSNWLTSLNSTTGQWPDVDYTTGCPAQTGSWPAQQHWSRITTFSAAWHGGLKNAAQWVQNTQLRAAIALAMGFWFDNDFTDPGCLDSGGTDVCPCGTPGLWNTNWFSNIILIPGFVGEVCLLLGESLTVSELANCTHITGRAYATFESGINGVSSITGSNTLDIASVGIDMALLTVNSSVIGDAFSRVHSEVIVENAVKSDGIRADGSFGQHAGILYNGNYGKDYSNDVLDLDIEAGGTAFAAGQASQDAFNILWQSNIWMIFRNTVTNVLHWDFSVLGRFISLPVADDQATENLKTNLTQLQALGQEWDSAALNEAFALLSLNTSDANSGNLEGNKMFFDNDYMVQRGPGYVTTLKMYSTRTVNSECLNDQNPFGFHLSDGTLYTHLVGNEYEDIFAAWDWNLIPGTTVDYAATPLSCSAVQHTGTQPFVGGASDGSIGIAAMRYETPTTKTLNWRKTWFFLPDERQYVMIARISSTTGAPVFSVLDQRLHSGEVLVDGVGQTTGNFTSAGSLWHGGVGYTFNTSNTAASLSLQVGERTGAWSAISTSKQPPATVDLFAAWLSHSDLSAPIDYGIFPATTAASFQSKAAASQLTVIRNDGSISALLDVANKVAMFVFWETAGGEVTVPSISGSAAVTVAATGSSAVIVRMDTWNITVADPTQELVGLTLNLTLGEGSAPEGWGSESSAGLAFVLPGGGLAGSSASKVLF
ncbi:polysaccharide lyase family 8 protein [Auriscalpium vulgare]|uniref:Polysaccharide lyase family 8 protein n=1 Tax=Auriscalpium vulgare TaxID=40419 RepID=A0ACB8RGR2_9AGAM|nr:polysaccharide lyase family 8 protein [Auriscalpium vulgare]